MRERTTAWACLLAILAVAGMSLPAQSAVICQRADGTQSFEWQCAAGSGDASDRCGDKHHDDQPHQPRIGDNDCRDVPARAVLGVNFNLRRETLRPVAAAPMGVVRYIAEITTRGRTLRIDQRPAAPPGAMLLRTVILLV